jgi:SulP family sulfate permease
MKQYFNLFDFTQKSKLQNRNPCGINRCHDIDSGSLLFYNLSWFPQVGLYAAFIMGLADSYFGGRPGLVSGGAGATVIVLIALMKSNGLEYVFLQQ